MARHYGNKPSGKAPVSRRELLRHGFTVGAALTTLGASASVGRVHAYAAAAPAGGGRAGEVIVRTSGGSVEDAYRKAIWEPFSAATGIQVVNFTANAAKVQAMIESGKVNLDVLDIAENLALILQKRGALEKLQTSKFVRTNLHDMNIVHDYYMGESTYATVIGYNTNVFPTKHPANWAAFWDVSAFPGPRVLEDFAADVGTLEFALLADGVPMNKLYPIDIDRAFKKLREIRKSIVQFWSSAAVAAQMLANKDAVLGAFSASRLIVLAKAGAPVAIEWNQAAIESQVLCILKGAPNLANAYKYLDFALQPRQQAEVAHIMGFGPLNRKAFSYVDAATANLLPTSPAHLKDSFFINMAWWFDNRSEVLKRWQAFLLGG